MVNIPGMDGMMAGLSAQAGQIGQWLGIILGCVVLMLVIGLIYYLMSFNIKCQVWQLYGSGTDGVFSVGKEKKQRFKRIRNGSSWQPLWPLMNREEIEPFDDEYVYPGQKVYACRLNKVYVPCKINIGATENQLRAEINPVPHYVRNWQSLMHKKNAQEFAQHNWWEDNKHMVMVIATVVACGVMVIATVYFTFKYAGGEAESLNRLASAIKNFGNVPGMVGPH